MSDSDPTHTLPLSQEPGGLPHQAFSTVMPLLSTLCLLPSTFLYSLLPASVAKIGQIAIGFFDCGCDFDFCTVA